MIDYWLRLTIFKMGFWITWTIIPVVVEIIPALISAGRLLYRSAHMPKLVIPAKLPFISIIVPVYNSGDTLYACIASIARSTYPTALIQVIVADNGSTDDSFTVFGRAQNDFANLNMQIIHTEQGKARALNSSIYDAVGTYIINIDSDGTLEKRALMNMVLRFENDSQISAMTGTILSRADMIKATDSRRLRRLRENEYFEYAQAFLSGRTIEASHNQLFTMSGAFSAFRRDILLQTFMYNTETVGEDTDMTFQIRQRLGDKVSLCHDAIFYIEPIDGWRQLYTQRQRWQRGELEVSQSFAGEHSGLNNFFKNFLVRRLMIDHTFMFPKMIWFFASIVLLFFRYSLVVMLASYFLIYLLYVLVSLVNYLCVQVMLHGFEDESKFYRRLWWCVLTLPGYNLVCSIFRLIGTINMMTSPTKWNADTFTDEMRRARRQIRLDLNKLRGDDKND